MWIQEMEEKFIIFAFLLSPVIFGILKQWWQNIEKAQLEALKDNVVKNFCLENDLTGLNDGIHTLLSLNGFKSGCYYRKHNKRCIFCRKDTLYQVHCSSGPLKLFICANPKCKKYKTYHLNKHQTNRETTLW